MYRFLGELVSVDEAIEKAVNMLGGLELGVVEESVWSACGHVLAEDIIAGFDHPEYDRSAVDGYAVIAEDTYGASPLNPVRLRVVGILRPGDTPNKHSIGHGEAVEVSTGAPLPRGANAVVMAEDTSRDGEYVDIYRQVAPYANVSRRGEDYTKGEVLVSKNTLLRPWHLGIIASTGVDKVKVYEKIRIAIFTTGDEVVEPGYRRVAGKLYNSTGVLVKNYLEEIPFAKPLYYGVYPDKKSILENVLLRLIEDHHVVVVTGGAGISGQDVIQDVVEKHGTWVFRGVAMRPGRPTSLALVDNKPVFLLSGFPVAAWTGLEALVTPILYRLMGLNPPVKPTIRAVLTRRTPNVIGYRSYIRVRVWRENGNYYAEPYMLRGSGVLSSLVKTNGYLVIPEDNEGFEKGDEVDIVLHTLS
ncbi:MAG: gephyrin-like molybdotransferase Glp [Thermoprotei archaeon]